MTADALAHAIVLGLACVALFLRSIIIAVFLDRPRHDVIARFAALLTRVAFDPPCAGRGRSLSCRGSHPGITNPGSTRCIHEPTRPSPSPEAPHSFRSPRQARRGPIAALGA
jgi:hypothetical protein